MMDKQHDIEVPNRSAERHHFWRGVTLGVLAGVLIIEVLGFAGFRLVFSLSDLSIGSGDPIIRNTEDQGRVDDLKRLSNLSLVVAMLTDTGALIAVIATRPRKRYCVGWLALSSISLLLSFAISVRALVEIREIVDRWER